MFTFGLICKRKILNRWMPLIALLSPVICYFIQANSERLLGGYKFGYELLLLNALLTILGMCLIIKKK
jgi:hypothetical protein